MGGNHAHLQAFRHVDSPDAAGAGCQCDPDDVRRDPLGSNENPPNTSTATGQAVVVLDPTANTIQVSATFNGLTTNDTMAHIHCCLASPHMPGNVGVATEVPAFSGFPLGVMSGTYPATTFDLTQSLIYNPAFPPFMTGGAAAAEAALVAGIENGETYFNIHTTMFPGGEIWGFLDPVPEPASLVLLGRASGLWGDAAAQPKLTSLSAWASPINESQRSPKP